MNEPMKPIIILPPETMSAEDMQMLRDNGLCVAEAAEPARVKFLDPIPAIGGRDKVEQAAIELSRKLLDPKWDGVVTRKDVAAIYCNLLIKGTPVDADAERQAKFEQAVFEDEKEKELRRLAREEAKAEREAAKKAKQKKTPPSDAEGQ